MYALFLVRYHQPPEPVSLLDLQRTVEHQSNSLPRFAFSTLFACVFGLYRMFLEIMTL